MARDRALVVVLAGAIVLHTAVLYHPRLSAGEIALQAALRVVLTTLPLSYGWTRGAGPAVRRTAAVASVLLLPYVLYNVFQVRHVAERFRLPDGEPFAPGHAADAWKLLPTLLYAALSLPVFFRCLDDLGGDVRWRRLGWIVLSAAGAMFGLFTRINLWELGRWSAVPDPVPFVANVVALAGTAAALDLLWRGRSTRSSPGV